MFSSGKHEKLTADPQPYINGHLNRQDHPFVGGCCTTRFQPRPFYDRPLTNPANPILEDVRLQDADRRDAQIRYWMGRVPDVVVSSLPTGYWYTADELNHARRVLARLLAAS